MNTNFPFPTAHHPLDSETFVYPWKNPCYAPNNPVKQSNIHEAKRSAENVREIVTICFAVTSDWMKKLLA